MQNRVRSEGKRVAAVATAEVKIIVVFIAAGEEVQEQQ